MPLDYDPTHPGFNYLNRRLAQGIPRTTSYRRTVVNKPHPTSYLVHRAKLLDDALNREVEAPMPDDYMYPNGRVIIKPDPAGGPLHRRHIISASPILTRDPDWITRPAAVPWKPPPEKKGWRKKKKW